MTCLCLYQYLDTTERWARFHNPACPAHPSPVTLGRMIRPGLDNDHATPGLPGPHGDHTGSPGGTTTLNLTPWRVGGGGYD